MSIESLCSGDIVVKQTLTETRGASMGVSKSYADGTAYDCMVQIEDRGDPDGARETLQYGARSQLTRYKVYFSQDVRLTPANNLKWTVEANETLDTPRQLRVLSYYKEGRPGEDLLWIADCELIETREE